MNDVQFQTRKNAFRKHNNSMLRFDLSRKICNMLKSSSPIFKPDQILENMGQDTLQSKQIYIIELVEQAGVDVNLLL